MVKSQNSKTTFHVVRKDTTINIPANGNAEAKIPIPTGYNVLCICGFYYTNWTGVIIPYEFSLVDNKTNGILVLHNANNTAANNVNIELDFLCTD